MTRRTAREMAQDRLATAKRKREAVEARIVRAGAELRAAELALREAEAAEPRALPRDWPTHPQRPPSGSAARAARPWPIPACPARPAETSAPSDPPERTKP